MYVADEWLNRVSIFSEDGEWISKWGTSGGRDGEVCRPSGMAFDADDNLLLADSGNNRVQKFPRMAGSWRAGVCRAVVTVN